MSLRAASDADVHPSNEALLRRYRDVRTFSHRLCEPLVTEDFVIQTMEDVSPTKWHLAHTSWFFETFILKSHLPGYETPDPAYAFLFNSYYVQVGDRHFRPHRGFISRPTVEQVFAYRAHVDEHMERFLQGDPVGDDMAAVIEVGLNHEQQHQELLLTDIKHVFSMNPLHPVYREAALKTAPSTAELSWVSFPEGIHEIGHDGSGFGYDNEFPRHRVFVEPFRLAHRLVTNGEMLDFMADGGYGKPELWLSDGWATVEKEGWTAPMYWQERNGEWHMFTLSGLLPVERAVPACHLSYYEADAYARWAGHRLPTEFEWEIASAGVPGEGNFVDDGLFHPAAAGTESDGALRQMMGDVWEWTSSHYSPYPGYRPPAGAIGEYNGKFMCNQFVLRGGSCATTRNHVRKTYRNFFHAPARWQFSGVRLASEG